MWALKRKLSIIFMLLVILLTFSFFIYYNFYKVVPTCFDGIKNGTEEGVDCGGACKEVCSLKATKVNVFWSRTFPVSSGVSNIAALMNNPNFDYALEGIFSIKVLDDNNVRLADFKKEIKLYPAEKRLLFIPSIRTGEQNPRKTYVRFESMKSLVKAKAVETKLEVVSKRFTEDNENLSKVSIIISNTDLLPKRNIEITTALYDKDGNVLNVGGTFLNYIEASEQKEVSITWPTKFDIKPIKIEVYLRLKEDGELLF